MDVSTMETDRGCAWRTHAGKMAAAYDSTIYTAHRAPLSTSTTDFLTHIRTKSSFHPSLSASICIE